MASNTSTRFGPTSPSRTAGSPTMVTIATPPIQITTASTCSARAMATSSMTELAWVHRLRRVSLNKRRADAGFKAIKLGFGFDEDFRLRRSIRQAVSETMIIMVDANHACDATAAISRPHTRLRSIASANDPMTYVLRAKSPLFARRRETEPQERAG